MLPSNKVESVKQWDGKDKVPTSASDVEDYFYGDEDIELGSELDNDDELCTEETKEDCNNKEKVHDDL